VIIVPRTYKIPLDIVSLPCYIFLTMYTSVRISSKRQVTIPAAVYSLLGLSQGDKLVVEVKNNTLTLSKAQLLLDTVAGSVQLPRKYKKKSLNYIIKKSKQVYFQGTV